MICVLACSLFDPQGWQSAFRVTLPSSTCGVDQWEAAETCGVSYSGLDSLLGTTAEVTLCFCAARSPPPPTPAAALVVAQFFCGFGVG